MKKLLIIVIILIIYLSTIFIGKESISAPADDYNVDISVPLNCVSSSNYAKNDVYYCLPFSNLFFDLKYELVERTEKDGGNVIHNIYTVDDYQFRVDYSKRSIFWKFVFFIDYKTW